MGCTNHTRYEVTRKCTCLSVASFMVVGILLVSLVCIYFGVNVLN